MKKCNLLFVCISLITLPICVTHVNAAIVDYTTATITVNADNIVTTSTDGVVITAYGYHAEFPSTTEANIYGPFPTSLGERDFQIFGVETSGTRRGVGLLAQTTGSLAPVEDDVETANFQPGLDNVLLNSAAPDGIQFALFTFSESVDVNQVVVGTPGTIGDIWVAGGSGAVPDLSTDFLGVLTALGVQTSLDTVSGPQATHDLVGLINIDYLLVGTPPDNTNYGPLTAEGNANFYIDELNLAPTAIPIPAAAWLFSTGLLGLIGIARRNKAA